MMGTLYMSIPNQDVSVKPTQIPTHDGDARPESIQQQIVEQAQQRIARDLHDELGQLLSTMRLNLHALKAANDAHTEPDAELKIMHDLLNQAQDATKSIVYGLRHADDDDFNLLQQAKVHIATFELQTGIRSSLSLKHVTDCDQLSQEQQLTLYRILQESLTNIMKHAMATKVHISIAKAHNHYVLTVKDNGRGIDKQTLNSKTKSFGLIGMRERMAACNGSLSIKNRVWGGTEIRAKLPVKQKALQYPVH